MSNNTMSEQLVEAGLGQKSSVTDFLTSEQSGALEMKYASLAPEIQHYMQEQYPTVTSPVTLYLIRQAVKEANSKLASNLRPGWITSVRLNVPALVSTDTTSKTEAFRRLRQIADELPDTKEAIKVLKSVKVQLDKSSTDESIVKVCEIFGINPSSIK